jgi:hypothetical protein
MNVDDAFGHWMAGFIAGEGSFRVQRHVRGTYSCAMGVKLRVDDHAILREMMGRTGAGTIARVDAEGRANPTIMWIVQSKADCQTMVSILDRYPLRGRKQDDYAVWREAVAHWCAMPRANKWTGPADWSGMARYKALIEDARTFRMPDLPPKSGRSSPRFCKRNHPLTPGDPNVRVTADGRRFCRACAVVRAHA